jgi:hypothetical protein
MEDSITEFQQYLLWYANLSDQDQTLIEATSHLGRHWKDIQREHFPGRSKNCIKNRYASVLMLVTIC